MGFFFFVAVAGIIFWLFSQRQKNVQAEWARAAGRLGLSYSRGGLLNPHWIYGRKAGLRYDIKTFTRSTGGSANRKWTGYRVRFPRSTDFRIRVTEEVRNQLTRRFQECEIDQDGIFCARPNVEGDAPAIIDNVERLQSVTGRLLAAAEAEQQQKEAGEVEEEEIPAAQTMPMPPPVPAASTPEPAGESKAGAEENQPDPAEEEPLEATPIAEEGPQTDAGAETTSPSESAPEPETEPDPETTGEEARASEDSDPALATASLATVSRDLFDSGRNRFQITQHFDAEYRGLAMLGEGKLVRAAPYANDRIFGRGPGTLAEIEIDHPEEPLPGHQTIRAVLQLPETVAARTLREQIGDTVTVSGTLLRCDAFDGRIFLETGELA